MLLAVCVPLQTLGIATRNLSMSSQNWSLLCDKINILVLGWQTDKDLHVLIRMCGWFFHEFVTLHPFLDGNGHIARFVVLHLLAMLFSVPIPLFSCTRLKFLQCIVGPCINNCKPVALTQMIADCVTEFLK